MKARFQGLWLGSVLLVVAVVCWHAWEQGEPRRACLSTLQHLQAALNSPDPNLLPQITLLPVALQSRTTAEQSEFIRKALQEEISPEGLAVLKKKGQFGSLTEVFPQESTNWATQAGVNPEDCVAFKLERNGLCAEVVLQKDQDAYRVLRCNNVKQLAVAKTLERGSSK